MLVCAKIVLVRVLVQPLCIVLLGHPNLLCVQVAARLRILHPGAVALVHRLVVDGLAHRIKDTVWTMASRQGGECDEIEKLL